MREFIPQIGASLREDDTWEIDHHWAENKKLGVKVWIANGVWFVHLEWAMIRKSYGWESGRKVELSLREKIHIWRAYRAMHKAILRRSNAAVLESIIERRLSSK